MPVRRDNPYASFNFVVEIDGVAAAGFAEVELGGSRIAVIEYREGSDPTTASRKLPGRVHHDDVVLRRGLAGDDALWQWFRGIRDGGADPRPVAIVLLDERRQPVATWRLRNAWPCRWEGPTLDARGNEVAIETLELTHEGLELE